MASKTLVKRTEDRIRQQMDTSTNVLDVKVDLLEYINSSVDIFESETPPQETHVFKLEELGQQDALLMQMPNINESGYYSGIVALRSYINRFHPELKVEIIDPIIDYFYLNPPDKESEFFNLFNTYSKQGQYELLYDHQEFHDMFNGFVSRYIEKCNPTVFGFSIIDGNVDASIAMARLVKEKYPDIKIAFGGNGIELLDFGTLPTHTYKVEEYTFIDFYSRGDGEETFVELLKSDFTFDTVKDIKGLVWWNGNKLVHNIGRTNVNMEILPYPDYSPLEENFYYKSGYKHNVPLVMSRGCPYRCSFCSVPEFIPVFRHRPVDNVIDEMEYWINKGRYHFFCHDSIINGNPKWLKEFAEKIIEKGWPEKYYITWGGNMRLQNQMRDLETMRLYRKSGLTKMITGFESASYPVLKHMKKYTNVEGVREIFENIRIINQENEFPLKFAMQIIIGYLNETEEDFQETVDFIKEYHDCMSEILTCSVFLLHQTLLKQWINDGEYIEFHNAVNFNTNYNSAQERLDRVNRIEKVFQEIGIKYNIYNRGLYYELENETLGDGKTTIHNEHNKK